MASKARARAELNLKNSSYHGSSSDKDPQREAFNKMMLNFRRQCNAYGIMRIYKEHEYFESKSRRDRRKRKESELRRIKEENTAKNGHRWKRDDRNNYKSK